MAPISTPSTASTAAPTSIEFNGDDFSNNLFSDLAPLLTLFGEQVTRQFFSMSFGWADNVLLAMGPLGIITTVVSAIRVGGSRKLKAIVGRARESLASAEAEILSSTSNAVCEMWSGNEIVRAVGQPGGTQELIILDKKKATDGDANNAQRIFSLRQAVSSHILIADSGETGDIEEIASQAPNLALNVSGSILNSKELCFWAAVGVLLQTAAIALPGLMVYKWNWQKGDSHVAAYGYPCFVSGTLAVIAGVIGCSHVIEGSTAETKFIPVGDSSGRHRVRHILRLQESCTVNDQHFPAYAIFNDQKDPVIRVSRLQSIGYLKMLSKLSTFVTLAGFVVQFVGLRALHWSATIIQLGITLTMTCIRTWVRRGLAAGPDCFRIEPHYGASWLTLFIMDRDDLSEKTHDHLDERLRGWELYTGSSVLNFGRLEMFFSGFRYDEGSLSYSTMFQDLWEKYVLLFQKSQSADILENVHRLCISHEPYEMNKAVDLYTQVYDIVDKPSELDKWSSRLCSAVEEMMSHLTCCKDIQLKHTEAMESGYLTWTVNIIRTGPRGKIPIPTTLSEWEKTYSPTSEDERHFESPLTQKLTAGLFRQQRGPLDDESPWKVDFKEISGIMALWVYSLEQRKKRQELILTLAKKRILPGMPQESKDGYVRILGELSTQDFMAHQRKESSLMNWIEECPVVVAKPLHLNMYRSIENCFEWPVFGMYMQKRSLGNRHENGNCMATKVKHTLHQTCALELFSFFMSAIASQIQTIGGITQESPRSDPWPSNSPLGSSEFIWSNTAIDALSSCAVKAGLVRTLAEAKIIMLPALFEYDLLPKKQTSPPQAIAPIQDAQVAISTVDPDD